MERTPLSLDCVTEGASILLLSQGLVFISIQCFLLHPVLVKVGGGMMPLGVPAFGAFGTHLLVSIYQTGLQSTASTAPRPYRYLIDITEQLRLTLRSQSSEHALDCEALTHKHCPGDLM
jgi:hypothetical protein